MVVGLARRALVWLLVTQAWCASLREIDWKNHSYPRLQFAAPWGVSQDSVIPKFQLVGGIARFEGESALAYGQFEDAVFGDLNGDGVEDAAIVLHAGTGGTQGLDMIYAFSGPSGRPMSSFGAGDRGAEGIRSAAIVNNRLVLELMDSNFMSGLCCSLRVLIQPYAWRRGEFVATAPVYRKRLRLDFNEIEDMERLLLAAPSYRQIRSRAKCPRLFPVPPAGIEAPTRSRFEVQDRCAGQAVSVFGRFSVELKSGRVFENSIGDSADGWEIDTPEIRAIRGEFFDPERVR